MILITGGTGFLGAYIIKILVEHGYKVRAIRRNNSKLPFFIPSEILAKVEWTFVNWHKTPFTYRVRENYPKYR